MNESDDDLVARLASPRLASGDRPTAEMLASRVRRRKVGKAAGIVAAFLAAFAVTAVITDRPEDRPVEVATGGSAEPGPEPADNPATTRGGPKSEWFDSEGGSAYLEALDAGALLVPIVGSEEPVLLPTEFTDQLPGPEAISEVANFDGEIVGYYLMAAQIAVSADDVSAHGGDWNRVLREVVWPADGPFAEQTIATVTAAGGFTSVVPAGTEFLNRISVLSAP